VKSLEAEKVSLTDAAKKYQAKIRSLIERYKVNIFSSSFPLSRNLFQISSSRC
jgi:hypothetical protein